MIKYITHINLDKNSASGKVIRLVDRESTVLEFGPSTGRMTKYLTQKMDCKMYIVEIDSQSYDKAKRFAVDGVCDDISNFTWLEKFSDIRFDYILFVDVLEHLPNPEAVLKKCESLLKKDGKIIVSIPNIAHNDIILKLLQDEFRYTKTGLLDSTHVHFWGYNDLDNFATKCGYHITYKDAVYQKTFTTEQNVLRTKKTDEVFDTILSKRDKGEVYQYVFVLEKGVKNSFVNIKNTKVDEAFFCNIYYDYGSGFNENDKTSSYITTDDNGFFSIRINTLNGVKRVRIDPIEHEYCLVSNLIIESEAGCLVFETNNATRVDNWIAFDNSDPQIIFDVPNEVGEVLAHGRLSVVKDKVWPDFVRKISLSYQRSMCARLYLPNESGVYKEENKIDILPQFVDERKIAYEVRFDKPVKKVRFDPVEGMGCVVKDIEFDDASHVVSIKSNGVINNNIYYLYDTDPQMEFVFDGEVDRFYFQCCIDYVNSTL